jgi:hypothetical protein
MTEEVENALIKYNQPIDLSEKISLREKMQDMFDDFLNEDFQTKLMRTHLNPKDNSVYNVLNNYIYEQNKEDIHLKNLMMNEYYEVYDLDHFYIFVINDNKCKIAQYCTNYIVDELMILENLFGNINFDKLKENVNKIYTISPKVKEKYLKKSKKKNKPSLYENYTIGVDILNCICNNSMRNLIGEKYGLENHVLDKLAENDSINSKLIIVINLDCMGIEMLNSVPYNLFQKGSAVLENETICRSTIDKFTSQEFIDLISR